MAEVEKVTAVVIPTDLPASVPMAVKNESGGGSGVSTTEYGTSPTQERSSNSHPHDSEYDTASDLEDGEEYDDDDLEDDESVTDDDDDEDDSDDEEDDDDDEQQGVCGVGFEKTENEIQKKVDEDRSNPQYIPKRGTFYEHDDRTAEVDNEVADPNNTSVETADGGATTSGIKTAQGPVISQESKTMKKWQPASGVDRWKHDRFDESEQAPKSRTELVQAYGYDIRTEEAPPRARRRRRYGRGPSKYSRNWEDESAYLKASNKERKPPRSSDFPSLNERRVKSRKNEKENRSDKRPASGIPPTNGQANDKSTTIPSQPQARSDERRERNENRSRRPRANVRQNVATSGRQAPLEFKQKRGAQNQQFRVDANTQNNRHDNHYDRPTPNRSQNFNSNTSGDQQRGERVHKGQTPQKSVQSRLTQHYGNDAYNNNSNSNNKNNSNNNKIQDGTAFAQIEELQQPQHQAAHNRIQHQHQQQPPKPIATSNLSQRLLQAQNRNDPSHVGSVQMHSVATQSQQQQLIGQTQHVQQANNIILAAQQPPQQQAHQQQQQQQHQQHQQQQQQQHQQLQQQQQQYQQQVSQEQRGPPKRYSSLRRSQHEAQHLADQQHQQLQQQLHLQPQAQPILLPDQHMLQANLMQLYHQENLQAQMQALQVSQNQSQSKQAAYQQGPPPTQPQPQPYAGPGPAGATAPTAYYVTAPEAQVPQFPQQAPNYLQQSQATAAVVAAGLAYATQQPPQPTVPPTAAVYSTGTAAQPVANAVGPQQQPNPANANQNAYPNYQNYNTVGGTTYFVPPPAQPPARPVALPQRRTNAIPILPPSEKNKQRLAAEAKEDGKTGNTTAATAPIGSADNIDHIIDNMFVQRPAFQPPQPVSVRKEPTVAAAPAVSNPEPTAEKITNHAEAGAANAAIANVPLVANNGAVTQNAGNNESSNEMTASASALNDTSNSNLAQE